ncbi:4-hydroxy-tetrahydrodipicolinate synthase [Labilibaculum euxinus]|uniref:4-hydroxy-tetrahydrodipicolinate synthase n=1 Tax=Labilibaculum euxinus TaxID=2686357 RepID=A0A7M4D6P8_9BACT|nr:4-hydroxy-tetrahydrodipicolinate synthase [Labilibaculum euxinus]MUP38327.1 4-hydroxy-tetrahydrodipicolinate synthase [Labilibaculum euxinus]MVB07532.1 4-hydroxy-tetrahydrodipicolinate synthase [Labilibaculum euxinus]
MRKAWQGSIVAIVTPFNIDGSIDYTAFDNLIDFHLKNETDGIVVCGTTGEAATLTKKEYAELIKHTVEKVNKRIPVIAGSGTNSTSEAIENSCLAEFLGVDAILVVSPYYNKPTRKGLKDYFSQISKAVTVPIILYNVPGRTGGNIPADLVVELATEFENVVGIKEASGNLEQMACILRDKPSDFMVFSGDDALAFQAVCMGADGVISVVANLIPKEFHNLMLAASKGDLAKSKEIYFKYLRLIQLCFIESNPIPVKTGLAIMNKLSEEFRSPMSVMVYENRILLVNEITKLKMI